MRSLLSLAIASLALASVAACTPSAAEQEAAGFTDNAITAPAAKTFKATCGSVLNSADISVTIEGSKVTKVTASISTRDGKLRSDRNTNVWEGELAATAANEILSDAGSSSATIRLASGGLALTASQIKPTDDGTELVSSCKTSSATATIDLRSTLSPDGILRGISFSGLAPKDGGCFSMDALTEASNAVGGDGSEGWWDITCDEEDTHTTAEGLKELVDALSAAANP